MNAKKFLVAAILLNVVLLAFAVCLRQPKDTDHKPNQMPLSGPAGKFGPTVNTVLPAANEETGTPILNLETGDTILHPPFDHNSRADAIMAGIRSNGVDISCFIWRGGAACVTYNLSVVAANKQGWDEITEEELSTQPELSPVAHSPRRLLLMKHDTSDTYMFRTVEGTLGMLRITGLGQAHPGVTIRYKLVNPAKSFAIAP